MTIRDYKPDDFEKNSSMIFVEFLDFLCRVAYLAKFEIVHDVEAFNRDEKNKDKKQDISDNWLFSTENKASTVSIEEFIDNLKILMAHIL